MPFSKGSPKGLDHLVVEFQWIEMDKGPCLSDRSRDELFVDRGLWFFEMPNRKLAMSSISLTR